MPQEFRSADELKAAVGRDLGHSDWLTIEQSRIDGFKRQRARGWHAVPEYVWRIDYVASDVSHGLLQEFVELPWPIGI